MGGRSRRKHTYSFAIAPTTDCLWPVSACYPENGKYATAFHGCEEMLPDRIQPAGTKEGIPIGIPIKIEN